MSVHKLPLVATEGLDNAAVWKRARELREKAPRDETGGWGYATDRDFFEDAWIMMLKEGQR